ncbi:unnamed protein product [Adineta steineri]|uniref:PDZ domain-containing protein n=1 Tax=Adineta steineri TaxID=433720 RepID=A0A814DJE3_9BILA|nr:unnamed protein product [Adineta steineri]CAF0961314.1 unnamed protein product [Adineta steineri]
MSFLIGGNCCLKLNSFICGSKDISTKKEKNISKETIVNGVSSNKKIIKKNPSSPITFYKQHHINMIPLDDKFQQQNYLKKDIEIIKKSSYDSSLNCSIDHRLFDRSHSLLNNEIIIKDVILYRHDPNVQLGLTLCYGITSQSTTNIYIEKVEEKSLAGRQGELQRGDQIIKINNQRVNNREQAIDLITGVSLIILQIIRFQFIGRDFSRITPLTEDDSGIILGCNTDFEINNQSIDHVNIIFLSCLILNHSRSCRYNRLNYSQLISRRCYSLNDLRSNSFIEQDLNSSIFSLKDFIYSQSLFETTTTTTTDNEKTILKPLPYNYHQENFIEKKVQCLDDSDNSLILNQTKINKYNRRRYREERLKEEKNCLMTTDDERMSELKQGKYWTRKQRKEQFQKSKQNKQKLNLNQEKNCTTEDFNLLNRIFLRENQKELKEKPYLAYQYKKQSNIEKEKLKQILQQYQNQFYTKTQSKTTASNSSTLYYSSTIII